MTTDDAQLSCGCIRRGNSGEYEYRKIKRPVPPPATPTLASTPRHRERPQRASGGEWPRQHRPPGVGQQAGLRG